MAAPAYAPARWLPHAHLQTVYASLCAPTPRVSYRRERWETPGGDFVDVDFVDGPRDAPSVHLFHGLEGSSQSHYARALMHAVRERGWRGSVLNFRGCSGEPNRRPRAYHSGDSDEVDWVLRRMKEKLGTAPLHAAGVSLGGNALLKCLGERGDEARKYVEGAAAVSAPVDLMAGGEALGRGFALLYARHFLVSLKRKSNSTIAAFPGLFDNAAVQRARTLRHFDDAFTAPVHGFRDAEDYWRRSSAKPWLGKIRVPTLIVNARDDPFMPEAALPTEREVSDAVTLEFPLKGGHVGFVSGAFPGDIAWLPRRLLHFFEQTR
jgi:predicted alpha/beta-fold hydrolase